MVFGRAGGGGRGVAVAIGEEQDRVEDEAVRVFVDRRGREGGGGRKGGDSGFCCGCETGGGREVDEAGGRGPGRVEDEVRVISERLVREAGGGRKGGDPGFCRDRDGGGGRKLAGFVEGGGAGRDGAGG